MSIFLKLLGIYKKHGYYIRTGLNPYHFNNWRDAPFTVTYQPNDYVETGGGIAPTEIFCMADIFSCVQPKNILVIGNAFGWSTLALALMNPKAKVVAIDAETEGAGNARGNELTRQLANSEGLNVEVIKGLSPQDTKSIVDKYLDGSVDFAFIDGLHTPEQQNADFEGIKPLLSEDGFLLMHDVINWQLFGAFKVLESKYENFNFKILWRTPSGMGIAYPGNLEEKLSEVIDAYSDTDQHMYDIQNIVSTDNKTF